MGLFDIFKGKGKASDPPKKRSEREMQRLRRLVGDKLAQDYDRQEAIEQLAKMGTSEAVDALLRRFSWSMDPSITDQEEKEAAAQGIVGAGEEALEPIRAYCAKADSITWPLKVLRQIVPGDQLAEELLTILDEFDTEYVRNFEPKLQLITALEEHPSDEVREAVEPFLQDSSEPVRFTAATTTFAMNSAESLPALIEAMSEEESLRVKNRISQGLAERGWVIPPELQPAVASALPQDFVLRDNVVRRVS